MTTRGEIAPLPAEEKPAVALCNKWQHRSITTLMDCATYASEVVKKTLYSTNPKLSYDASKFVLTFLQKAKRLEREVTPEEEEVLNEYDKMSAAELTAALREPDAE